MLAGHALVVAQEDLAAEPGAPAFKVKRNRIEEVFGGMYERWSEGRSKVVWHAG